MAADVSDMIGEEVSRVGLLWLKGSDCCALCIAEPVSLRLPVFGSMSPTTSSVVWFGSTCRWSAGMSGAAEL